jgi:phosphoribosylformylglycinamidine (FGAM) synthase-like amidotransferase family enzyme
MKKVFVAVLAVCIGIAFVATVFAQAPAAPETAAPAPAPEKKAETKAAWKGRTHHFRGEVTAMDTAAKTLTVKGKKGDRTFDVTDAKMKGEPKAGDRVTVKYLKKDGKMVARYVKVKGAKKTEKHMAPETAAPAPAPAK